MKAYSKEFEEIRDSFEKIIKSSQTNFYLRLERSAKEEKNSFYDSGETDKYFQMFMNGYELAKCNQRLEN